MGQYFRAVNATKREFVCPWCIAGGAKLWEWAVNRQGAIFTVLLRKSDQTGGGDYGQHGEAQDLRAVDSIVGRWAGDVVYLIGDYDSSKLYENSEEFTNISGLLVSVWNEFVEIDSHLLTYMPCSGHA